MFKIKKNQTSNQTIKKTKPNNQEISEGALRIFVIFKLPGRAFEL